MSTPLATTLTAVGLFVFVLTAGLIVFAKIFLFRKRTSVEGSANSSPVKNQHNTLRLIIVALFLLFPLLDRPIAILLEFNVLQVDAIAFRMIYAAMRGITITPSWVALTLFIYHVHYDLNYTHFLQQNEWVQYLQSDFGKTNWYARHKGTLGRWTWTGGIIGVVHVLYLAVDLFSSRQEETNGLGAIGLTVYSVTMVVVVCVCGCKMKNVGDSVGVYATYIALRRFMIALCLTGLIFGLVFGFLGVSMAAYHINLIASTAAITASNIAICIILLQDRSQTKSEITARAIMTNEVSNIWRPLRTILLDATKIQKLMEFMLKQFSHENLLFVIEISQFEKRYIDEHFGGHVDGVVMRRCLLFQLADEVPRSDLVWKNGQNFDDVARAIREKYVESHSKWMVNLSWECRENLLEFLHLEKDEMETRLKDSNWIEIFQPAVREIATLVRASIARSGIV